MKRMKNKKNKKKRAGGNSLFYNIIWHIFVWPVRLIFPVRAVNPEKLPKDGCILCANHTSMLDVLILSASTGRQIRYMAKAELFRIPLLKQLITALGAYPVNRSGADVSSIRRTISMIEEGAVVGIFPQGTRHPGADPAGTPIRHGVGMIAWHAKCPLVPAFIRTKNNRVRPFCRSELIIGDPIPFDGLGFSEGGRAEYKAASEKVFTELCALGGYTRALPAPDGNAEQEAAK